jgi:hypothetical protein
MPAAQLFPFDGDGPGHADACGRGPLCAFVAALLLRLVRS